MSVSAANLRLLPTSPLKQILLPQSENVLPQAAINSMILKARADSTASDGSENCAAADDDAKKKKGMAKKRERKSKKASKAEAVAAAAASLIPFVKHHHSVKKLQTPSVSRRNARERNRVKQVNNGFSVLRNAIPQLKNKTSKVDTLRAAVDYIKALRRLIGEDDADLSYDGPVLITDALPEPDDDHRPRQLQQNSTLSGEDAASTSPLPEPERSTSAQSGDVNPLVYSLPPAAMGLPEFTVMPATSSCSSSTPSPKHAEEHQALAVVAADSMLAADSCYASNDNFWWQGQAPPQP